MLLYMVCADVLCVTTDDSDSDASEDSASDGFSPVDRSASWSLFCVSSFHSAHCYSHSQ